MHPGAPIGSGFAAFAARGFRACKAKKFQPRLRNSHDLLTPR
jgi:hypothetical protein